MMFHPYIHMTTDNFEILDGFYARLLINVNGLFNYVVHKSPEGMNKEQIFELIELIRSDENMNLLVELRNCYYQTGFLVFVDDRKNVIIYNENYDMFLKWFGDAREEGPSSNEVYEMII